jgi:serine/threonine protein kinase
MRYTQSVSTEGAGHRPTRLGKYELITRIGQGGMAEVQLAIQRGPAGFEKLVVVKLVHENLATQKAFVDMLLDEARVAALVKHPNVVDIYDLGEADGRYFIAMEYLEGEPLLSVLRAGREGNRLDVLSTTRLVADTAEGLDAAHELRSMAGDPLELVHHDVSLGNIVVLYNGQVKLVDFGVAKATQNASNQHRIQGKFSYMAPEKLKGSAGDRRSDIWSLGVVLWEALTLKRLFRGGNDAETMRQVLDMPLQAPSEVNGDCPPELDPLVMRALQRDPDDRFGTAKDLAEGLEDVLTQRRYGRRNDSIAHYMQDTFKDHIVARKKLLQEVSSQGVASTEILDLAFSEPLIASGSAPGQADFSVRFRRNSLGRGEEPSQPAFDRAAITRPSARSSAEMAASVAAASQFDTAHVAPLDEPSDGARPLGDIPRAESQPRRDATPVPVAVARTTSEVAVSSPRLEPKKPKTEVHPQAIITALPPPRRRAPVIVVVAVVTIAVGAAAGWWLTRSGDRAHASGRSTAPAGSAATSPAAATTGSAATDQPPGVAPTLTNPAETLYHDGMQALDAGDVQKARTTLHRAEAADPSFAPSYRALGLVYERLGDKASEKVQLVKYLQLAPSAADAPRIRDKLAGL